MKAKFLWLFLLLIVPLSLFSSAKHHRRKVRGDLHAYNISATRSLFEPTLYANEVNDCLLLTFQFSLNDVDITITDKDGNEVMKEQQSNLYEGRTISIPETDGYPYSIEITSPTVDIQGEIILE